MKNLIFKDFLRTVKSNLVGFISVIIITAIGVTCFIGINSAEPDMKDTARKYFHENNLYDIKVSTPVSLTKEDADAIKNIKGVSDIMPSKTVDGILKVNDKSITDIDGSELSCRVMSLNLKNASDFVESKVKDDKYMNKVDLIEGRMPKAPNECVVDSSKLSAPDEFKIGQTIKIESSYGLMDEKLQNTEYKITGKIRTPLFLSFERGRTSVGSGKLGTFIFVSEENFLSEDYNEIFVKVAGADKLDPYSEEYEKFISPVIKDIENLSKERLPIRVVNLRQTLTDKVSSGKVELAQKEAQLKTELAQAEEQIKELENFAKNGEQIINDKKKEFNNSLNDAQRKLYLGEGEHNAQYAIWRQKQNELNRAKIKMAMLDSAQAQYNQAQSDLAVAKAKIDLAKTAVDTSKQLVVQTESALEFFKANQGKTKEQIEDFLNNSNLPAEQIIRIRNTIHKLTAVGTAEEMINYTEPMLINYKRQLIIEEAKLNAAQAEYDRQSIKLAAAKSEIDRYQNAKTELARAEVELAEAERKLNAAGLSIDFNKMQLSVSQQQLKNEIEVATIKLEAAKEKSKTAKQDFEKQKALAYKNLDMAKGKLAEAEKLLNYLDRAEWFVDNREEQVGYSSYTDSADRMKALSKVFPVIFFIVAALVCLITLARLVENERTQMGTMKALGYDNFSILSKYLYYGLSASILGCIIGMILGFEVFPRGIIAAWGIMYDMPKGIYAFRIKPALLSFASYTILTFALITAVVFKELKEKAAILMRPKPPKAGKRIFLENLTPIWSRLNFTSKITARNLFRNKKNFITAFIGISGCCALLLASFGLSDSINAIMSKQFGKGGISKYDLQIVINKDTSDKDSVLSFIKREADIKEALLNELTVTYAKSPDGKDSMEVNMLVPQNPKEINKMISLHERGKNKELSLSDNGAIITEKLANEFKLKKGDKLTINYDNTEYQIPISDITENYTFHYLYLSPALFEKTFNTKPNYNYINAKLTESLDSASKDRLASNINRIPAVDAVAYTTQITQTFKNIVNSLNLIVILLIAIAAMLSFAVMYNLSNINIYERRREVSTIKVLGFNDKETGEYIIRENIILTLFGATFGLLLGVFLHKMVVSAAEINVVMFGRTIEPTSYLFAFLATILFSALVNLLVYNKLKKIDMVSSLKSVE
ncbi:MAG: FtsX-like permease family protein [Clostridia bacterium]|nr:FtsX-like permease family protein [Clostridia bacterium]